MLFRHKEGRASWVALMSRPPPFTTWNIILFAMIIGPMFSSITGAIFGIFVESAEIVSVMSLAFLGWLFGLIPAFVCGVLFANLRGWFGTGYSFAACCGIVGVLPFIYLSGDPEQKISASTFLAVTICGLSAIATRFTATLFLRKFGARNDFDK